MEERRLLSGVSASDLPTQVWVDDHWALAPGGDIGAPGLSSGDTVQETPGGATHTYGLDAYSTIQDGANFVRDGGVVIVLDGLYTERVAISRSLTISGQSEPDVIIQADSSGAVDGHDAFDINAPGANVSIDHVLIRNSDWGIRSVAGNVSVTHCAFTLDGFDGSTYPSPLSAIDAAAFFAAHATDGGAIWMVDSTGNEIAFNSINSNDQGIVLTRAGNSHIHDNTVTSNARGGINLFDGSNNVLDTNDIEFNGGEGLLISGEAGTSATGNQTLNNANAGIVAFNPKEITLGVNLVYNNNSRGFSGDGSSNQWPAAIYADGAGAPGGAFTLHLDANSLNNNGSGGNVEGSVGIYLGASLRGDGTTVSGQTINNHAIGLRSSVSNVSITNTSILRSTTAGMLIDGGLNVVIDNNTFDGGNDTSANTTDLRITAAPGSIGSLTNTKFRAKASGGKYIVSLRAQEIDASTDRFLNVPGSSSAVLGSALSLTQLFAVEDRIDHGLDTGFAGFIRPKPGTVVVTNLSGSIQRGINVASANDTINVKAGSFTESLSIDKGVTVSGQGDTTILRAPASIPTRFTTSADNHPIVFVTGGAKPTIRLMKIDGLGNGIGNERFEGIAFFNAGGVVDHVSILAVREAALSSEQSGVAIYANNTDGVSRGLAITNNTITDYQSSGMSLNGAGLGVDVSGNTVTGAGPTNLIAQIGIQISSGATGNVLSNIISGNQSTDPGSALAAGISILNAGAGVSATGNTVSGNNIGIYSSESAGVMIDGNDVSGSDDTGIFVFSGDATVNNNNIHDNSGDGLGIEEGNFGVTNNNIHLNVGNGISIRGDGDPAAFSPITASISNNFITGNHLDGIFVDASVDGGSGIIVRHNDIREDSDGGLDNESSERIDAKENWWGSANGPTHPNNHYNIGSQGSENGGLQDFAPWLISGADTQPAVAGFQPDSATFSPPITNDSGGVFTTIQSAIYGTSAGGTITLADGTYVESNIVVDRSVQIVGQSEAGVRILPQAIGVVPGAGSSLPAGATSIFLVAASNVSIHDLTINGDNPGLTSGIVRNGADIDARNGIITDHRLGIAFNNLEVDHVTVNNIYLRGIYASSGGTFNIHDNTVDNVAGEAASVAIFNFGGSGIIANNTVSRANDAISANNSTGTQFLNNTVTQSGSGVHSDNNGSGGVGVADLLQGNHVSDGTPGSYGVWVFNPYLDITVSNNTVSNVDVGLAAAGGASALVGHDVLIIFDQNDVDLANRPGSVGAYVTTDLFGFGDAAVSAQFINNNDIANAETGIFAERKFHDMKMSIIGNIRSIHGNHIGIDVTGGSAQISDNRLYDNDIAIRVSGGASASIDGNVFRGPETGGFQGPDNRIDVDIEGDAGLISPMHGNSFGGDDWYIQNHSAQNIDASGNLFDAADNFGVEDKILHKMDDDALGLVSWVANNLYVTDAGTDHSIQHAIDSASAGDTINVEAGTYFENLIVDKSLTFKGANDGIDGASAARGNESFIDASGTAFTVDAAGPTITISGFKVAAQRVITFDPAWQSSRSGVITVSFTLADTTGDAVSVTGAHSGIVSNNSITSGGAGIVAADLDGDLLADDNVISAGSTGINVSGQRSGATRSRSNVQNNRIQSPGSGVLVSDIDADLTISNNDIDSTGPSADAMVITGVGKNSPVTRSNISNNRISATGSGIVVSDLDGDFTISLNDVTSTSPSAAAIVVTAVGKSTPVTRSNISNNRTVSPGSGVVVADVVGDLTLSDNDITSTGPSVDGMVITVVSKNSPVTRSNISNNRVTAPGRGVVAIDVDGDLILDGNTITTGAGGVDISASALRVTKTRSNIQNNRLVCGGVGVLISGVDADLTIAGNDITAGAGGVDISGSALRATKTRSNIQNNRMQSGGIGALVSDVDADVSFAGNTIDSGDTGIHLERIDGDVSVDQDTVTSGNSGIFADGISGKVGYKNSRITFGGGGTGARVGLQAGNVDNDIDIINNDVLSVADGDIGIYIPDQTTPGGKITKSRSNIQNNRVQTPTMGIWLADMDADGFITDNTLTNNGGGGGGGGAVGGANYIGIHSIGEVGDMSINDNTIQARKARALVMVDSSGSLVADGNTITAGISGIEISGSDGENTIGGTAGNDITVDGSFGTGVSVAAMNHGTVKFFNNRIHSDFDGISLEDVDGDVEVGGNTLDCASTGLNLQRMGGDILIHGNDFAGRSPTPGDPGNGFGIQAAVINGNVVIGDVAGGNTFHDLTAGILIDTADGVSIGNNSFDHLLAMAAEITDGTSATLSNNSVNDADTGFVVNSHTSAFDLSIFGNFVTNAHTGFLLQGDDKPLMVTVGLGNKVHIASDGIIFSGAQVSIAGNTLADLDMDGIADQFVNLIDSALHGDRIDGSHVRFNGVLAPVQSVITNFEIEDKITHATDDSSVGFISVYPGNVFVTQSSGSIQRGVNAAEAGDTLHIGAGTFSEAVVIDKWMGVKGTTGPVNTVVTNPLGAAITITAGGPSSSERTRINDLETKLSNIGLLAPAAISHLTIGNITATQNVGTGIELHAVSDAVIEENELGFGHDLVIAGSEHITVSHNIFVSGDLAITIDHDSNVTIAGNQIHHVSQDGIHLVGGNDTITIGGNDITDVDGNAIALTGIGGGNSNVSILNNNLQRNTRGISGGIGAVVDAVEVHTNSIADNTIAGIENNSGALINATGNWWGSPNGPTSSLNTWAGSPKGDKVLGSNVVFAPWLTDGVDADPATRGFQHAGPDTIAPAVSAPDLTVASDSGTSDHDDITKINTPTFTGTAEPGATVDLMEGTTVLGTTSADATGNWSITSSLLSDGIHNILARATDASGNASSSATLVFSIDTAAPPVNAGADQTVNEADLVTLTATLDDGTPFGAYTFHWTQTDGPFVFTTQSENQLKFSPPDDGVYTFTVTATDLAGNTGSDSIRVTAQNVSPHAAINGAPSSSPEGNLIDLTSTVFDPGTLDTFTYAWTVTKNGAAYASGSASIFSFTPNDDATYVVTLTVTDDDGGIGIDSKTVNVTDVEPTISLAGNTHTNEGATYTLTLGAITDPGADTVIRWYVNWGDSSPLDIYTSGGAKTHVYADGPATRSIVVSLEDENGIHANAGSFTVTVDNAPPIATFGNLGSVNEGSGGFVIFSGASDPSADDQSAGFRYSFDFNNDGVFEIGNGTYAFGSTSASASVPAVFLADGPGTRTIRGRISDHDGGFSDYLTTITINNVTPIVNAGPDTSVGTNSFLTQSASFTDPGADSPWQVYVNYNYNPVNNPGLGILSQSGSAKTFVLSHFYSAAGTYTARVTVIDKDGASGFDDVVITVANTRFQVTSFTPTVSGFDVRFNRAVNTSNLNLYDGLDASIDPSDVTFFGTATGQVRGSIVWDFQGNLLHFVRTGGPLAPDNYTLSLQSRADGFTDAGGELLDGNLDGVAGGDYSSSFTVSPTTDRTVSLPDFARGPGQPVNIPATGSGIPIRIDNAAGVNAVDLDVIYDGFQLSVTGATLAPGMPADWSITTNLLTNGIFKITISGVSTLPAGARDLIILSANVASSVPYGGSGVIRLQNLSVNGGFIGSRADAAVHKTTFLGDASGNGSLDGFDSSLISRVVVSLDSGFDHASMTDPTIVADANSNGVIDGLDASWVAQKSLFAPLRPEIPNLPSGPIGSFAGFDPTFAMSEHVHASVGGSAVVPLRITDSAEGLIGFNINVDYTTAFLDVADGLGSSDVMMGSLFSSTGGWTMVSFVDDASGHVGMAFFRATPMTGGAGSIADIQFHVPLSDPTIATPLDVNGAAGSETGLIYTYNDGSIDIDASTPSISGTDGDDIYYVRHSPGYDSVEVYAGASAAATLLYSGSLSDISSLSFDTGAGDDQLIVDLVNGMPLPSAGISYAAGADNDSFTVIGNGSGDGSYRPAATTGSGQFAIGASAIAFSGVEPITASDFATLSIVTPSATDTISIDKPVPWQNRLTGTSGGITFSPLTFFNLPNPIIDTATNDPGGGSDSITISDGMAATVTALGVNAGTGANTLTINGGTVPLLAIDGANLAVTAHNSATVSITDSQVLQSLSAKDTAHVTFPAGPRTLHVGSLLIDPGALVDVNDGRLEIENSASFSTIRSYIRNARNNGAGDLWTGNGLSSSYVAANSASLAVASVLDGSMISVRAALIGDLNLDNQVSISDFIDLASNFSNTGVWATGDLNYDDNTTISDFIDLASHFGQTYPPPPSAPVFAAASEAIVAAPESVTESAATTETSSSPAKGAKKTHSRRVVRHHRPGRARPGISRHQ